MFRTHSFDSVILYFNFYLISFTVYQTHLVAAIFGHHFIPIVHQGLEAFVAIILTDGGGWKMLLQEPGNAIAALLGEFPSTFVDTVGLGVGVVPF